MLNRSENCARRESTQDRHRHPSYRHFGILHAAILLGLFGVAGRAEVIYTNLAQPPSASNALPGSLTLQGGSSGDSIAQAFVASRSDLLANVKIALASPDGTGSFSVALMTNDPNTGGPGTILEQFDVPSVPIVDNPVVPIVLVSVSHPALTAGTTYWLVIMGTIDTSVGVWQGNLIGQLATSSDPDQVNLSIPQAGFVGPWIGGLVNGQPRGAFEVAGNPSTDSTTPTVSSIAPNTVLVGSPALILTVNGTNFVSGATLQWSGINLSTTFVSPVQLTAAVTADLIASVGTNALTVTNPDGTSSNAAYFTTTAVPRLTITGLSPNSARAGGANFTLTIAGSNFTSDATVKFGGSPLSPTSVTPTRILVAIPSTLIAAAGIQSVTVSQASGTSNEATFTVIGTSSLSISGLSPSSAAVGGAAFTLTITGSNFTSGANVHFGTSTLTPTSLTLTQIQVTVPSTLLATAGTQSIIVVQASGTSNAVTFSIGASGTTSSPVIGSLNTGLAFAGGADFTLTITGDKFTSDALVLFGGIPLTPTFVTSTQVVVSVPSSLIAVPGTPSVTVAQLSGTSNASRFAIIFLMGQPLSITTGMWLPAARAGFPYPSSLIASGGTPPYVWTLVNSALPPGMNLSSTGAFPGAPAVVSSLLFTAKVTDSASATLTREFILTVDGFSNWTITTADPLPAGIQGLVYSQALAATGGNPPYQWSVVSGGLPVGLSLSSDGLISGTPTTLGTNNVTLQATDGAQAAALKSFSFTINPAIPAQSGVLSHFASGGGWKSSIYLVNASASAVPVVVKFWADSGSALSLPLAVTQVGGSQNVNGASVNETIAPNATLLIESDSRASVTASGWAEVISTGPATGYGVFHYTSPKGGESEGTLPLESSFTPSFILPYDGISGLTAGVALTNLAASQAAAITATIWDENGKQIGTEAVSLPAGGHTSFLLADKFPETTANRGIIEFRTASATSITGFGLRVDPAGGLTMIPKLQRP